MKLLFVFGTRPEAIKFAPLVYEFKSRKKFKVKVCVTAQHREMLDQVLNFFSIKPDFDLNLMKPNQSLFDITSNGLKALETVFLDFNPDIVFVQGDTTTAFIGALAGYYSKSKVAHIEAGLRSGNKYSPFPEEQNRILAGHLSDFHFAPTPKAVSNLKKENITNNVWNVGNTVIDALFMALKIIKKNRLETEIKKSFSKFIPDIEEILRKDKIVLVTGHRRESFGEPFENICNAIKQIADDFENVKVIYPVHLNPNVRATVNKVLKNHKSIHLIEPLDYPSLIWLMEKSYFVLTDSGGIQEEAPSLGKPVLVMRDVTERVEGIKSGTAKLVGTDKNKIYLYAKKLLTNKNFYNKMSNAINPYGDGKTAKKIADILEKFI